MSLSLNSSEIKSVNLTLEIDFTYHSIVLILYQTTNKF